MSENTMQALDPVLRRRAALLTLSEVFEGEQLMCAMWMIEEKDQSANKYAFIGFVGLTAEFLGINSHIVTMLYRKLNKNLDLTDQELPDDPMPEMLEYRDTDKKQGQQEKSTTSIKQNAGDTAKKMKGSPEMTVFVALISSIATEAGFPQTENYLLFNINFKDKIASVKLKNYNLDQIIAWADTLDLKVFKRNISEQELSGIVDCLYTALSETFGAEEAGTIMNHAISRASKIKAAALFAPKRFLK